MNTAALFDLENLSLVDEADKGKWFKIFDGKMEVKVASSTSKKYQSKALGVMRQAQKKSGKDMDNLPADVMMDTTERLLATQALKGWSMLVPEEYAKSAGYEGRKNYLSDDEPVEDGYVLIDMVIYTGEVLPFSQENAIKVISNIPDFKDEVATLANNRESFRKGGVGVLD